MIMEVIREIERPQIIFYLAVSTLSLLFLYAGISVFRTFNLLTVDSGVLFNCALINMLAVAAQIYCEF